MTLPLAGHPVGAKSSKDAVNADDKIESAYRFLLADLMPFGKNALIRLEHGGKNDSTEHYETVTYWYGLPAHSLVKTDELAVGDKESEKAHRYVSPNASVPYTLTSRYEWGPDTLSGREIFPASVDQGRITKTWSEFTLRVDPANLGVMLRRRLDYAYPNQRAKVYVADNSQRPESWNFAGIWYTAGSNTVVRSYGGVGARLVALDRLWNLFSEAHDRLLAIENGNSKRPKLEFVMRAEAFATRSDPPSQDDLTRLRDLARESTGAAEDATTLAYARALESAINAVLAAGYDPNFSEMMHRAEVGPTEHLVTTSNRRFRDDEFLLPLRLTRGCSKLRVRVEFTPVEVPLFPGHPLPDLAWSEMRYTVYSFRLPAFPATQP
jgi:hypothetical protein